MVARKRRSEYTGKFANLHKTIRIGNNSTPVDNKLILATAKDSHDEFYKGAFAAISELGKGYKND